jgi:hypothetical protein
MRISEKTIELNYCAQLSRRSGYELTWFGLTQKQEARAGFDACAKLGGRLVLFQFKASNHTMSSGARRFVASHDQLDALRKRCSSVRSVFYAFPLIGTTLELTTKRDLLANTWLLDVRDVRTLPAPTGRTGRLRKNGAHYVHVFPGRAIICSEPVEVPLVQSSIFAEQGLPRTGGFQWQFDHSFPAFWEFSRLLSRTAVAVIVAPR